MFVLVQKSGPLVLVLFVLLIPHGNMVVAETDGTADQFGRSSSKQRTDRRGFTSVFEGGWSRQGISYGPYREGQSPGKGSPSRAELTEDLRLLANHWNLIRMYGADEVTAEVLQIIRDEKLPIRLMLGAWIGHESASDTLDAATAKVAQQANRLQVATAIRLANQYPEEVVAISVGNETQVFWSDHLTQQEVLIRYLREARQATSVPVTTADDFNFWNKPESKAVAAEVDFIVTHIHAMWAGLLPSTAMEWTEKIYAETCVYHPGKLVVIGEAGWATQVHTEGEQATHIKGEASELQQQHYYEQFTHWAEKNKVCTFFFEAFDEPWKGGPHPDEVEKHWGLIRLDRSPKAAMRAGFAHHE